MYELKKLFSCIRNITSLGLNLVVDVVKDRQTKERDATKAHMLMNHCMKNGVSFKLIQGNTLNLKPSFVITKKEIDFTLQIIEKGLKILK